MFKQIRQRFGPPVFADEEESRLASLLNLALLAVLVLAVLGPALLVAMAVFDQNPRTQFQPIVPLIGAVLTLAAILLRRLIFRGKIELVGVLLSLVLMVLTAVSVAVFGGIRSASAPGFLLVIIIAALLLRERSQVTAWFTAGSVIVAFILYSAELLGLIAPPPPTVQLVDWLVFSFILILVGLLLRFAVASLNTALDRARRSEKALVASNEQLQTLNLSLEERVAARTRALALSAQVGRRLSTILDQTELLAEVVEQIQTTFDYYHVHVYLRDGVTGDLHMAGGTGEAGRLMLVHGHTIPRGGGLVGRAAETNEPVLVPDVSDDRNWLPNPLLPDTKAETAVPISRQDEVLGVLDVQQNLRDGLTHEDVDLLQSLANQIAIALQNARLYAQAQRQAERQALINTISQKIQGTRNVEAALQTAVREIGHALDVNQASVRLRQTPGSNGRAVEEGNYDQA